MNKVKTERDQFDKYSDQYAKLLRIKAVSNQTGLSQSYIYALSEKKLFPKSIKLVPGGTSVAWVEQEVLAWIDSRIEARNREPNLSSKNDCVDENSDIFSQSIDQKVA